MRGDNRCAHVPLSTHRYTRQLDVMHTKVPGGNDENMFSSALQRMCEFLWLDAGLLSHVEM